jgi:hypothetical protein
MKAITLHQPWASLIAYGLKTIETRPHDRFRSLVGQTVAIHAGLQRVEIDWVALRQCYGCDVRTLHQALSHSLEHGGCVVAVADVTSLLVGADVFDRDALCPTAGRFGLSLARVRRIREPIPATGRQGIWTWEPPENWRELLTD